MELLGIDILIWILLIMITAPMAMMLYVIIQRNRYPIRATVATEYGGELGNKVNEMYTDRIGYFEIKDSQGKLTGGKEWRLQKTGKPVSNLQMKHIGEMTIPMIFEILPMRWKRKFVFIHGVSGEKGMEFYPIEFELGLKTFKPVYDTDLAVGLVRIVDDIERRNKKAKDMLQAAIVLGIIGAAIVFLLLQVVIIFQLGDIIKALQLPAAAQAAAEVAAAQAGTPPATATPGMPFGLGG
jgi:hypothetical protein